MCDTHGNARFATLASGGGGGAREGNLGKTTQVKVQRDCEGIADIAAGPSTKSETAYQEAIT